MYPVILAIESSCDETAAAVIAGGVVLSNVISAQPIHADYGGVVPELASRAHQRNIAYVVDEALHRASQSIANLNAIAFTAGPGLPGSLLVGVSFAKSMALALGLPLIEVNHMHAHVMANFIEDPKPQFPFLCLTASGGHTQLTLVRDYLDLAVIGETQDDAVGEAFDKAAKILELPYPGGPHISRLAEEGNPYAFSFPGATMPDLDFSFSGVKTAFLYFVRAEQQRDPNFSTLRKGDLCASLQRHLVAMLIDRLEQACVRSSVQRIALAGGVSANALLRKETRALATRRALEVFIPDPVYCTDNAAMIAMTAHYKFSKQAFCGLNAVVQPRMALATESLK